MNAPSLPNPSDAVVLAQNGLWLMSWWKPILLVAPFVGWAWLVSTVFDKHAARFYLGREKWNLAHMLCGLGAVAAGLLIPIEAWWGFAIAFLAVIAILGANIGLFVALTNRDERVPEHERLRLDFSSFAEARKSKAEQKHAATVSLQISGPDKSNIVPPDKESPEFGVRVAAEQVFIKGRQMRASQVDLGPAGAKGQQAQSYAMACLVDGVRQPGEPMPAQEAMQVIDFWKKCAGLDVNDRRRRLSGLATVKTGAESVTVRVVTSGSQSGVRLTLQFNPAEAVRRGAQELGLLEPQLKALHEIVESGQGVVLLAAPPDQGRTTTLYSLVKMHDAYTSNVQTVELEPEDSIEGVRQIRFDTSAEGSEFSTTVRSVLRRDPDVVGVAELPDVETAKELAKSDIDRTRVYVSVKAESALAAVQLWTKAVGDAGKAAESLHGVLAQRLVRRLCENCRVAYPPPPDMLKKLGLPADKVAQLYKKGGQVLIRNKPEICPVCQGIGYIGQEGIFEIYPVGVEERRTIAEQNWSGLRAEFRKRQLPTIQQAALRKALEGVTSVEEIMRVTGGSGKPGSGQGKPASTQSEQPA